MAAIKEGRVCVILKGKFAGSEVKITKILDNNFVEVAFKSGKTKKMNVLHLEPTPRAE